MNARDAKRESCFIVGLLIEGYLDVGQPFSECRDGAVPRKGHKRIDAEHCADCDRLFAAMVKLCKELAGRS